MIFDEGSPHLSLWFLEHSADLTLTDFSLSPEHPAPGEAATLSYTVTNEGDHRSQPTLLEVYNNTTVFRSETIENVGTTTIPPLGPGETFQATFHWTANTRMTWYGQNPYVQLFDAWLDLPKDAPDPDPARENNRRQDYVLLRQEDGNLPTLPGYQPLP
jgi:hypothetical protein